MFCFIVDGCSWLDITIDTGFDFGDFYENVALVSCSGRSLCDIYKAVLVQLACLTSSSWGNRP